MSDTPARLSNTTSFALWSIRIDAARCASSADVGAECGTEAAIDRGRVVRISCSTRPVRSAPRTCKGRARARAGALTRSQTASLLDDPDANLGLHVGVQLDRHAVDAERLDRLVQIDQPALDVEALRGELLGDVRRRDGAEQLALFTHASGEGELHFLELLRELGGRCDTRVLRRLEPVALLRDPLQVARR